MNKIPRPGPTSYQFVFILVMLFQSWEMCSARKNLDPNISPEFWPEEEMKRYTEMTLDPSSHERDKPLGVSHGKGLVIGTSSSLGIHSGLHALREGGNAMDACLATAMAQVPLVAGAYVSFMGLTNILYYEKSSGKVYNIDGGWKTPKQGDFDKVPPVGTAGPNGASVLVPGFIAGVSDAADKFAKFSLSTLLQPALYFADKGFTMTYGLAGMIKAQYNEIVLLRTDEGKEIFTNPTTGKPYQFGDHFKQPKMAEFIRNVSEHGKDFVYKGQFAEELISTTKSNGGYLTLDDMQDYQALLLDNRNTTYKQNLITTTGKDWGGLGLIEKLNLFELAGIGNESYITNETQLFWMASIIRWSWFISTYSHSVPNGRGILSKYFWGLNFTDENRLKKEFAKTVWSHMVLPGGMREINKNIRLLLGGGKEDLSDLSTGQHSDAVIAADSEGNVCSMVHTINSLPWGTGLFVQGNALSNSGSVFKYYLKNTPHGAPLPSPIQPAIVFKPLVSQKDEEETKRCPGIKESVKKDSVATEHVSFPWRAAYAVSVVGSSHPQVAPQLLTNLIDQGLNPTDALHVPNLLLSSHHSYQQDLQISFNALDYNILNRTREMGQQLTEISWSVYKAKAGLGVALSIDENGNMYGATTPFLDGTADSL